MQNIFKFIFMAKLVDILYIHVRCTRTWSGFAVGTERPKSKLRSMKFSVGLPQPAYAFVSDMSVPQNSS